MSTNAAGGQLVLNLAETTILKSSFRSNYSVAGQPAALGNELEFSWNEFKEWAIEGMTPDLEILGLIHRYEPGSGNWFLTAARYSFSGYVGPFDYSISGPNGLFNLNADGSIGTYNNGLEGSGLNYYDPEYFDNVLYDGAALDLQLNVHSVRFAWEELKQLHCDNRNNIPGANDALFTIRFCSISPDYSNHATQSLVAFPHTIGAYMAYNGVPLLNDDPVMQSAVFTNKAADYASACPPTCPIYVWPVGLTPKNC